CTRISGFSGKKRQMSSKEAERQYAGKVDQEYLFKKPFNEPRVFREFALVLDARQVTREFGITELGFTRRQLRHALREAGFTGISFLHDPGPSCQGLSGFVKTSLRVWFDYFLFFPQAKNIVVAQKG